MKKHEIENWVLSVVDLVQSRHPIEDDNVELKASWIPPQKAARRLAGHANRARGAPILWIIGVDESQGVVGAPPEELSAWFSQVSAEFNDVYPDLTHIGVPARTLDGRTVILTALFFETDRGPFLVRNPQFGTQNCGPVSLEIPWREGTSTRTATRSDLIRLLSPLQQLPQIDLLRADVSAEVLERNTDTLHWNVSMQLYSKSPIGESLVVPFHECDGRISVAGTDHFIDLPTVVLRAPGDSLRPRFTGGSGTPGSLTIQETTNEIILSGPGRVHLTATAQCPVISTLRDSSLAVAIHLRFVNIDIPKTITAQLQVYAFQEPRVHRWGLRNA